ncbi:photo-regulated tyrosinase [Artomyces pyxidatus]|uniref:Photo-regulated tyrosinase n=1 Tax=Artomyces pyxidatus TaxID=48021 RepID=A0ACB8TB58_9AGAM|nr:photo-regulated tyrosinase [Artomyces pyxidatus]
MSHIIITGATGGHTEGANAPNRRDIEDLVRDEKQFSLYIQALTAMFHQSQNNSVSFFQIGGIHGLPYVPWEGSGTSKVTGNDPRQWEGYCTHGSILFPTWHRPYVALFEQVLHKHAVAIAQNYHGNDRQDWITAASNLRAPFWDWAKNIIPPAEVISSEVVYIVTPYSGGKKTSVSNPLYKYTFHPIHPSFPKPFNEVKTTVRQPDLCTHATNVERLKTYLQSIQHQTTAKTYNLLTRVKTWPAFSNHTHGAGGNTNSLEAIHDEIHDTISGQMGRPDLAGFDPIFFLHHANVDRMLSLWAVLNPGVWVGTGPAEHGSFTIQSGTTINASTTLTPFWNSQTTFWSSSNTADTAKLGYTYPEFNSLDQGNRDAARTGIARIINKMYGGPFFGSHPSFSSSLRAEIAETGDTSAVASAIGIGSVANTIYDWTARILFKKYELGGSFSVLIFLGTVPDDPAQWRTSPSFVGTHSAFVNGSSDLCANCRNHADTKTEGFVHLDPVIAKNSGLGSFDPDVVVPYLERELSWRVQKVDGVVVPVAELPSLEVLVISTPLTLDPGDAFPVPGETKHHHGITRGREGGALVPA